MLCPLLAQFEPKLMDHNETIVHHILVYACGNASALPKGISDCYGADPAFSLCSQVIVGWAVGGTVSPPMRETRGEGTAGPTEGWEMVGAGASRGGVWDEALPPILSLSGCPTSLHPTELPVPRRRGRLHWDALGPPVDPAGDSLQQFPQPSR